MTDYAKKTVAELQEILKSRSLAHTGKKAELVARLNENDHEQSEAEAPVGEDGGEEAAVETLPEPVQQPTLVKPIDPVEAPAVPASSANATDPNATTNAVPLTDDSTPSNAQPPTFTANLSSSTIESEIEKRKARAARFGASATTTDSNADPLTEAEKAAQRASRFGLSSTENSVVKGLDEALPERRERSGRGGGHRGRGGGGRGQQRGGGGGNDRRRRGNTPRTGEKGQVQKQSAFSTDSDRAAAEARRKRFAAVS